MKIIFATGNKGKLREAAEILGGGFALLSPADLGITEDVEETGDTLLENSVIKANYIYARTGLDCFADDTGLEVDALGGAPGVHSARYATEGHDFEANIDKLLAELEKHPGEPRTARFRSVVTLIFKGEYHFLAATDSATTLCSSLTSSLTTPWRSWTTTPRTPSRIAAKPCARWRTGSANMLSRWIPT